MRAALTSSSARRCLASSEWRMRSSVRRGGSWHTWPFYARVAFRNWNSPQTRYVLVGFRLLCEARPSR